MEAAAGHPHSAVAVPPEILLEILRTACGAGVAGYSGFIPPVQICIVLCGFWSRKPNESL